MQARQQQYAYTAKSTRERPWRGFVKAYKASNP